MAAHRQDLLKCLKVGCLSAGSADPSLSSSTFSLSASWLPTCSWLFSGHRGGFQESREKAATPSEASVLTAMPSSFPLHLVDQSKSQGPYKFRWWGNRLVLAPSDGRIWKVLLEKSVYGEAKVVMGNFANHLPWEERMRGHLVGGRVVREGTESCSCWAFLGHTDDLLSVRGEAPEWFRAEWYHPSCQGGRW